MNAKLDTLVTALYVTIDDALINHPEWVPQRPVIGFAPRLSDAELLTLGALQALLGYTSEARFICYAHTSRRCSPICLSVLPTTNGSATPQTRCVTSLQCSLDRAPATPITSGWLIPPPLNAAAHARP